MKFNSDDAQILQQIMQRRRDVRHFCPDSVAAGLIDRQVASMEIAPSVDNCPPRRVIWVQNLQRRRQIAGLFAQSNATASAAYPDSDRDAHLGLKLAGPHKTPEHLAVFSEPDSAEGRGLGRQTMPETVARTKNLGLGWVSIPSPQVAAATFDPPPEWQFTGYLCVGYAVVAPQPPSQHRTAAVDSTRRTAEAAGMTARRIRLRYVRRARFSVSPLTTTGSATR